MKYFLDNNLPPRFAKAINALLDPPDKAVHLKDIFSETADDIEWLAKLGREPGWIVVSGDMRITKNAHERRVWQESKLTAFFLQKAWVQQKFWLQAAQLIRWWPDIMEQARKVERGAGFLVPFKYSGRFKQPKLL